MSNILFAVHRSYPFPGGSEFYVHDMAKEAARRGHYVTVLAHEIKDYTVTTPNGRHNGIIDGVKITDDYEFVLNNKKWDLIVVHGGDVITQNTIHINAVNLNSPILYMLIKPSDSAICVHGGKYATYVGYSTSADIEHIKKYGWKYKARRVRHGINVENSLSTEGKFKERFNINPNNKLIVSAGGFYPHKGFDELIETFKTANTKNTTLALFGYSEGFEPPDETENIRVFSGFSKAVVMQAIVNADLYVMNSTEEGFGLVLLEAMLNKTPWIARRIAGALDMQEYGTTYLQQDELCETIKMLDVSTPSTSSTIDDNLEKVFKAYNYVMADHTIVQTVDDIEDILQEIR